MELDDAFKPICAEQKEKERIAHAVQVAVKKAEKDTGVQAQEVDDKSDSNSETSESSKENEAASEGQVQTSSSSIKLHVNLKWVS